MKKLRVVNLPGHVEQMNVRDLASVADRLKFAAGERAPEIAARIGVSSSTIYKWLAGQIEPNLRKLTQFAAATGFNVAWLVSGQEPQKAEDVSKHARLAEYLFVELQPPSEEKPAVAFYGPWLGKVLLGPKGDDPPFANLMLVSDDAMEPTFREGDLLLIDRGAGLERAEIERARNEGRSPWEGIYAFQALPSYRGEQTDARLVARRVHYRLDGTMVISCDNTKYPEETYPPKAKTKLWLVGRVIWRGGRI